MKTATRIKLFQLFQSETFKSFLQVAGSRLISVGLGFISGVLVAKALGPADFGIFSIATALSIIVFELTGYGLETALVRFMSKLLPSDENGANLFAYTTLKIKVYVNLVLTGLGFFLARPLALYIFHRAEYLLPLQFAFLMTLGLSLWRFTLTYLQGYQLFGRYALVNLAGNVIKLMLIGSLWALQALNLMNGLLIYTLTLFLGALLGFVLTPKGFWRASGDRKEVLTQLFQFSKWVILSHFMVMLYYRLDMILLGYFKSSETVGFYSVALNIVITMDFTTLSLLTVFLPQVSRLSSPSEYQDYMRKSIFTSLFIFLLFFPIFFLAKPTILYLYGPIYLEAVGILRILFWGGVLTLFSEPIVLIVYSKGRPQVLSWIDWVVLGFSFIANYLIIPHYGAQGAAFVALCARGGKSFAIVGYICKTLFARESPKL